MVIAIVSHEQFFLFWFIFIIIFQIAYISNKLTNYNSIYREEKRGHHIICLDGVYIDNISETSNETKRANVTAFIDFTTSKMWLYSLWGRSRLLACGYFTLTLVGLYSIVYMTETYKTTSLTSISDTRSCLLGVNSLVIS